MTTMPLQIAPSAPTLAVWSRQCRLGFEQLLLTEVRVLLVAAGISLCFLVFAPIGQQHQGLDERAMLAAMFAAGGMPLVYAPPALCRAPKQQLRFDQSEMSALLRH